VNHPRKLYVLISYSPSVLASVKVELRLAQILGDGVPSDQDRSLRESSEIDLELVQVRLVPQSPSVDGVLDPGDFFPGEPVVGRSVNREVRLVGGVVLPSG
jgi:hypothetical protein